MKIVDPLPGGSKLCGGSELVRMAEIAGFIAHIPRRHPWPSSPGTADGLVGGSLLHFTC